MLHLNVLSSFAYFSLAVLLFGSTLLRGVKSQIKYFGGCPNVEVQEDFEVSKYTGLWYETEKYPTIFQLGGKCTTANYTILSNDTIRVINRQLNVYTGKIQEIYGQGKIIENAKLTVELGPRPFSASSPYWVLSTDYDKYAVVYTCFELGFFHKSALWILTRERNPSSEIITNARKVIGEKGLSVAPLTRTDQSYCDTVDRSGPISISFGFIKQIIF